MGVASAIGRFGAHEFTIRRAYAVDPEFREICDYLENALLALSRWSCDEQKAGEYRRIVAELEDELRANLEKWHPTQNGWDKGTPEHRSHRIPLAKHWG